MNVIERPHELVIIWASLKRGFERIISEFMVAESWSWKQFADICQKRAPTCAYYWINPAGLIPKRERQQIHQHRRKVTKLILRTAKEFWLPRRELIEDEHILSMNTSLRWIPPARQAEEKRDLALATRIAKFKRRLGGFYLLWALYWNQPGLLKKFELIDITPYDYETMMRFEAELKSIPIAFVGTKEREQFVEQVQFMMNQFKENMVYQVCLFSDEYHWKDLAYLNTKYEAKAEILEWEKSLKERLLFHPKIREAVLALDKEQKLDHDLLKDFDPDFITEAVELLRGQAMGEKKPEMKPNPNQSSGPASLNNTSPLKRRKKIEEVEQDKKSRLAQLAKDLIEETLKSPYKIEDLIPVIVQKRMHIKQLHKPSDLPRGVRRQIRSKNAGKPQLSDKIDYGNIDNLKPVFEALGLTPDIKSRLHPLLSQYFRAIFEEDVKPGPSSSTSTVDTKKSLDPPEWNFVYASNLDACKIAEVSEMEEEEEHELRDSIKLEMLSQMSEQELHDHDYVGFMNMPSLEDEVKEEIKSEPPSPPEEDDGEPESRSEKGQKTAEQGQPAPSTSKSTSNHVASPRKVVSPVIDKKNHPEPEEDDEMSSDSESELDEPNVEDILKKLSNYPGLLEELRASPVRKPTKRAPRRPKGSAVVKKPKPKGTMAVKRMIKSLKKRKS